MQNLPPIQLSRVLYSNPVCFLTVYDPSINRGDVMALSWLTPIDNQGSFVFSQHSSRYCGSMIQEGTRFGLSIPVQGMEKTIRGVGGCSGRDGDKFDLLDLVVVTPGSKTVPPSFTSRETEDEDEKPGEKAGEDSVWSIDGCAAHLVCRAIKRHDGPNGHFLWIAQIEDGFVHSDYWNGKHFVAQSGSVPATLSFLGGGDFASTRS